MVCRCRYRRCCQAVTILPDLNDPKKESSGITGAGAGSYVAPKDALKSLQDDLSKGKLKEVGPRECCTSSAVFEYQLGSTF